MDTAKFKACPVRMIRFEGVTVRSDALATLALLRHQALTANAAARARGASSGSTSNTLRRLASVGVLQSVELPPCANKYAPRPHEPLTGYQCTDLGRRLLDAAERLLDDMVEQDPEATWPKVNTALMVQRAVSTQPASVFHLGRCAANESHMHNGAFA